jgi:hypothetical protein
MHYCKVPPSPPDPKTLDQKAIHLAAKVNMNVSGELSLGWFSYFQVTLREMLRQGFKVVTPEGRKFAHAT